MTKKMHMRDARLLLPSSLLISAFNIDKMENTLNAYEIFIMCVNKWYKFFSSVILKDNFHVGILEILRGHTKLITNTNFIPPFPFVYNLRNLQQKPDLYNILEGKNARAFFWPIGLSNLRAANIVNFGFSRNAVSRDSLWLAVAS
jgi:hypothetical protein